ncbi:MAG: hypothetical protein AWU57_35 [Marinobacter sp. T13-3]|nr:MAG: hypothetical protein AWU57_35 [Marinobacter sp. T13-3]
MIGYILIGVAAGMSLFGFGILAMIVLIGAIVQTGAARKASSADHRTLIHAQYVRRVAITALCAHLAITVFLVTEMVLAINSGEAGGIVQAFVAHYLIDHVSEFVIGAWTAYRAIKGGLHFGEQKAPCGSALTLPHAPGVPAPVTEASPE